MGMTTGNRRMGTIARGLPLLSVAWLLPGPLPATA